MRWLAWFCVLAVTAAFAQDGAGLKQRLKTAERTFAELRAHHEETRFMAGTGQPDVRGRREADDFDEFVFTHDFQQQTQALLERAQARSSAGAAALAQVEAQLGHATQLKDAIAHYWDQTPANFWRDRWTRFAEANGLPLAPPDPGLESAERVMLEQLAAGDFARAGQESAPRIDAMLRSAIANATTQILQASGDTTPEFIRREDVCTSGVAAQAPNASALPRRTPPISEYYPAGSKRRNDQGDVVVRAWVAPTGCAYGFAIMVSSGYPELDAAAIKAAQASRYSPAAENGTPIAGRVTFKVKFTLHD